MNWKRNDMNIEKKHIESVIIAVFNDLKNDHEELYMTDGTCLFQIRGPSGGVATSFIFYILEISPNKAKVKYWGEEIYSITPLSIANITVIVSNAISSFRNALRNNKARIVDLDGGDFGRGDNAPN